MTVQPSPLTIVQGVGPLLTGAEAVGVIKEIVGAVGEWVRTVEQGRAKRADIAAKEAATLAAIAADRDVLLTYLDRSFDERKDNFKQLFTALDDAIRNNPAAVADVLGAITTLAVRSPFADLADAPRCSLD